MQKPLTLEEVQALVLPTALWVEENDHGIRLYPALLVEIDDYEVMITIKTGWIKLFAYSYGKRIRMWSYRPTDEERVAAKWKEEGITHAAM